MTIKNCLHQLNLYIRQNKDINEHQFVMRKVPNQGISQESIISFHFVNQQRSFILLEVCPCPRCPRLLATSFQGLKHSHDNRLLTPQSLITSSKISKSTRKSTHTFFFPEVSSTPPASTQPFTASSATSLVLRF